MKFCTKCKQEKELVSFSFRAASPDGYQPLCKECKNKWAAARWQDPVLGPILRTKGRTKYHSLSAGEKLAYHQKYYDKGKNSFQCRRYRFNNKEKVALMLESSMLYYRITAYDNLKFFCKIYKVPNYKEKILNKAEEFGLTK